MFNLGEMNKILDNRNMPPSLADQFRAKAADPEKGYLDGSEWKQLQAFVKEHKAEI